MTMVNVMTAAGFLFVLALPIGAQLGVDSVIERAVHRTLSGAANIEMSQIFPSAADLILPLR